MRKLKLSLILLFALIVTACKSTPETTSFNEETACEVNTVTETGTSSYYEEIVLPEFPVVSVEESDVPTENIHLSIDITHDGIEEDVYVDFVELLTNSQAIATIQIFNSDEDVIWSVELGLPHMAWAEYYIVELDGDKYIFEYLPDESQGDYCDSYRLFYLSSKGEENIVDEMNLYEVDESELSEKLKEYYEKTADYISKGKLLISTWENELKVYSE